MAELPSVSRRLAQIVSAVFFCLFTAGVVFGYAALKPLLIEHGVYSELCTDDEKGPKDWACSAQDLRLNLMFTVATVCTNAAALPVGAILDRFGPRWTSILGAIVFALGNFTFGLQIVNQNIDTYITGFVLIAVGGPLIFLPSFHLSNAFPKRSGLILSFIVGSFDTSSVPYLIYRQADKHFGKIPIRVFFWGYIIIPTLLIVEQCFLAPSSTYKREDFEIVEIPTEETPLLHGSSDEETTPDAPTQDKTKPKSNDRLVGVLFGKPVRAQIMSRWFAAILLVLCVYMTRINYVIQTVFSQVLFYLHDRALAESLATTFTVLLPLGGVVGIPPIGWLLDKRSSLYASNVLLVAGVLYGVLAMLPFTFAQVMGIVIFVVLRPFMYTYVGDYCGKVFGYESFGTVYGLVNSVGGISQLLLRPLDVFVKGLVLGGNYNIPNSFGLGLGVLASGVSSFIIWNGTRRTRVE